MAAAAPPERRDEEGAAAVPGADCMRAPSCAAAGAPVRPELALTSRAVTLGPRTWKAPPAALGHSAAGLCADFRGLGDAADRLGSHSFEVAASSHTEASDATSGEVGACRQALLAPSCSEKITPIFGGGSCPYALSQARAPQSPLASQWGILWDGDGAPQECEDGAAHTQGLKRIRMEVPLPDAGEGGEERAMAE